MVPMTKIDDAMRRAGYRGNDELGCGPAKVQGALSISVQVKQSSRHLGRWI